MNASALRHEADSDMNLRKLGPLKENVVFCSVAPAGTYRFEPNARYPELPQWAVPTTALKAFRSLLLHAGLDRFRQGLPDWNPLGDIITAGQKVVIKPNWVHHQNGSGQGLESLVTHTSVLEAILHYVVKACPKIIVLGDAPVQGCDFATLMDGARVPEMIERFSRNGIKIEVKDFRRTIHPN